MSDRAVAGKYRLGSLLGRGGMGVVYEATHVATGKRVAVKLIDVEGPLTQPAPPDHLARFEREARAAGTVDTQHIVQVLDAGTDAEDGTPYIAMELLAGEDLSRAVQRLGPLPPSVVVKIAAQALTGLAKAHEAGVIHRDIKSANLFLAERDGDEVLVKLLDFGVAKIQANDLSATQNTSITRTGSMLGSPMYMSPEQARGSKDVDARTDLWSLGVVMYEALTGGAPARDIQTIGELILAICSSPAAPVQDSAPWVPPGVARIVHKALAIRADDRYPTAKDMLDAVRAVALEGTRITKAEVVGVGATERRIVAPRHVISAPGSGLTESGEKARSLALDVTVSTLEASAARSGVPSPPRRWPSVVAVAVGGAALVALGGVALRAPSRGEEGSLVSSSASPPPAAVAADAATSVAATATPPATTSVRLKVAPATARVEIDGVEQVPADESVVIVGTLGSLHAVRVWSGAREARASVAITVDGPLPDAVVLDEPARAGKGRGPAHGAAKPASSGTSGPSAPRPAPTPDPSGLHMDTEFR